MDPEGRPTVVAVIGATGTGKSKLALELAAALAAAGRPAELVSVDALQLYKGGDVITNKVTAAERAQAPHHLLDCLDPVADLGFNVLDYRARAWAAIDDIWRRGKVPILVGGTHYYLQAVLWNSFLVRQSQDPTDDNEDTAASAEEEAPLAPEAAYARLKAVDPDMAAKLHPNDHRRIRRSLEVRPASGGALDVCARPAHTDAGSAWARRDDQIYDRMGVCQTQLLRDQVAADPGPRYRTLLIWLATDMPALDQRLDARLDEMVQNGMADELDELWRLARQLDAAGTDYRGRGLYQAIGYKEFLPYLDARHGTGAADTLDALFQSGVARAKTSTRRYARRQVSWIQRRLWPAVAAAATLAPPHPLCRMLLVDSSDPACWTDAVQRPAVDAVHAFVVANDGLAWLDADEAQLALRRRWGLAWSPDGDGDGNGASVWRKHFCDACHRELNGAREWTIHLASRGHRTAARKAKQRAGRQQRGPAPEPPQPLA